MRANCTGTIFIPCAAKVSYRIQSQNSIFPKKEKLVIELQVRMPEIIIVDQVQSATRLLSVVTNIFFADNYPIQSTMA